MPKKVNCQRQLVSRTAKQPIIDPTGVCTQVRRKIMLADLQPVKVLGKGMAYYHKEHYAYSKFWFVVGNKYSN